LEVYESQEIELVKTRNMMDSARVEGETAKAIEIAKAMLGRGFDSATITEITQLTAQEIEALKMKFVDPKTDIAFKKNLR
jgi:hypothetical protein